jgi:hypothetical protein
MNKCLAPCNQACTPEGAAAYAAEAAAVQSFFSTHGESMLAPLAIEREAASAELDFERAARVHEQWRKAKAAQSLADELVHPIPNLHAVILQKAAQPGQSDTEAEPVAAVFLLRAGCLIGPARLSTLGVRAVKEQTSVGSSLFAQPLMLEAVPLADEQAAEIAALTPAESPEVRAEGIIAALEQQARTPDAGAAQPDLATLSDHLSLLRRWYYRPEKQRAGEVFFPREDQSWPIRRILRGAARMALGDPTPMAETQRDLATRNSADEPQKPTRTKVLHPNRPDVERTVPVVDNPPAFKSRRKSQPT